MRARLWVFLAMMCSAVATQAGLSGYVFLYPIEQGGSFKSYGEASWANAVSEVDPQVALSGKHSVQGPQVFTHPVNVMGLYSYHLEGPADPGACYGTTLEVNAHPSGTFGDSKTWNGPSTECAPQRTCLDANNNGICDNQETIDKDPNEDSCPGGAPCSSPIIVNLTNGPYRLSGTDDAVHFDIDADREPNHLTWTARGTAMAFLALDRNGNGAIDDGSELFGNWTMLRSGVRAANGFEALKEFDSNGDRVVDARDRGWQALLLWTDVDHDGVSQSAELQRVDGSIVRAFDTMHHWTSRRDPSGNYLGYQSLADLGGRTRAVYDVFFRTVP